MCVDHGNILKCFGRKWLDLLFPNQSLQVGVQNEFKWIFYVNSLHGCVLAQDGWTKIDKNHRVPCRGSMDHGYVNVCLNHNRHPGKHGFWALWFEALVTVWQHRLHCSEMFGQKNHTLHAEGKELFWILLYKDKTFVLCRNYSFIYILLGIKKN